MIDRVLTLLRLRVFRVQDLNWIAPPALFAVAQNFDLYYVASTEVVLC